DIDPELTQEINFRARSRCAQAAKELGVQRYVLSSSCSVYGSSGEALIDEGAATNPLSTYAQCNISAEDAVLSLSDSNFTAVALRNGTVFGLSPRMRFDLIVNLMVLKATLESRVTILGGGRQMRPLVHVGDVADAIIAILIAPSERVNGQVFNNALRNMNVRSVAMMVRQVLGFPIEMVFAPDDIDKRSYSVCTKRLEEAVGFKAAVSVEEGIREVYEAVFSGEVEEGPKAKTVSWYRYLIEAQKTIQSLELDGRIF
ncbi:MAG: SDR family oxidoreductase, partial [Myxococcota bacterium]